VGAGDGLFRAGNALGRLPLWVRFEGASSRFLEARTLVADRRMPPHPVENTSMYSNIRPEQAVEMFRLIPHAQLAIFPNADHFMTFMQPKKLQSAIVAFLDAAEK
jgi:pimeloyl-ACP methyl ester carboxylesterase